MKFVSQRFTILVWYIFRVDFPMDKCQKVVKWL